MPERETLRRAAEDAREGKAASTQAGEFVREEIDHIRRGKHGARSTKQAIAIGLSKARRAGVKLKAPSEGRASAATRTRAQRDLAAGTHGGHGVSRRRSRATTRVLRHEGRQAAAPQAISRQAKTSAKQRGTAARSTAARQAARTKGPRKRSLAARKAARTRARAR
jgi:hypothetical protein